MKYIKLFESFKKVTRDDVYNFFGSHNLIIGNFTVNDDNTIDVDGDVDLSYSSIVEMPFKFGKVTGDFNCSNNNLESLEGSPYEVGGKFTCSYNHKLKNLKGSPVEVYGDFKCSQCRNLESLNGMPLEIGGDFICYLNPKLKEMDSISNINGEIAFDSFIDTAKFDGDCSNKEYVQEFRKTFESIADKYRKYKSYPYYELGILGITNYTINKDGTIDVDGDVILDGLLKNDKIPFRFGKVTGNFYCKYNDLTSLDGCPYYVGEEFSCGFNKIVDLKGSPIEVGGGFFCHNNPLLSSMEGIALEIGGVLSMKKCPSLKELDILSNIEGYIYCDESLDTSKFLGYCKGILQD